MTPPNTTPRMTPQETRIMDSLAQSCPDLQRALTLAGDGGDYLLTGSNTEGRVLIRVQANSLSRAERLYRETYRKLENNGMLRQNSPDGAAR